MAHEQLGTFLGRNAPLEPHVDLAKGLHKLVTSVGRKLDRKQTAARHALALEDLKGVYETAVKKWPPTQGRPLRVPNFPSPAEKAALEAQASELDKWVGRARNLGVDLPKKNLATMLVKLRASAAYIHSRGGPVKMAAEALARLTGVSVRQLQKDRRMPIVDARRYASPGLRPGDPQDEEAIGEFAKDVFAGRDPLVEKSRREAKAARALSPAKPVRGRLIPNGAPTRGGASP
jgi:hypothetical protein